MVDRIAAHGDALNREDGEFGNLVVIPGVVAIRAFTCHVAGMDDAFKDNLGVCRHLQIVADALRKFRAPAAQEAGKLVFGERIRYRGHRAQNGGRITAKHHRHWEWLARIGLLEFAEIQGAATMRQPAHDHAVAPEHLLTVDAKVLAGFLGPTRHHQAPGDQWRHVSWPAVLNRQARQIDLLAFPDNFLAEAVAGGFRRHVKHLFEHRPFIPGIAQAFGRLRLFQIPQQLADFAHLRLPRVRPLRGQPHAQRHAPWGAKEIDQNRDGMGFALRMGLLKEQCRATGTQHPVGDLGHFQMRVDRHGNPTQFSDCFELLEEIPQISVLHLIRSTQEKCPASG